jgi:FkbM family methyltransferase
MYSIIAALTNRASGCVGLRVQRLVNGFDHAMVEALRRNRITSVVDVGANTGQFAEKLRQSGYGGDIYSFEPLPTAFALLNKSASKDPLWHIYQFAIGDRDGLAQFFETKNSVSSSLLPLTSQAAHQAAGAVHKSEIVVSMRTLESVAASELISVDWKRTMLKIDVQGAECFVIKGAKTLCDQIPLVAMEISFQSLYENSESWLDILSRCASHGLTLIDIDRGFRDLTTCQLLQADVLLERLPTSTQAPLTSSGARPT